MDVVEDSIASRSREARVSAGRTQRDVAEASGLREDQVAKIEAGTTTPGSVVLAKLARGLGVSSDWLLGLSEKKGTRLRRSR